MRRLFPVALAFACVSAMADPTTFTFDLRYDDFDNSLWPGHFTVDGPIDTAGTQTFSTENGKLLELSFTLPFGTYDLLGGHPNITHDLPDGASSVTFENGVFAGMHYRIRFEGCDECMRNSFISVDGKRAWIDNLGQFSVQNVTPVPEPSSVLLLLGGLAALLAIVKRNVRTGTTRFPGAPASC
jgi:hypothetical protein